MTCTCSKFSNAPDRWCEKHNNARPRKLFFLPAAGLMDQEGRPFVYDDGERIDTWRWLKTITRAFP